MKKVTLHFFLLISFFILALWFAYPVFAHEGEPRIEISTEKLNPGASLEIRGVDFEFEEEITLALVGPQTEISLGNVVGDAEGGFLLTIALPIDLAEGQYAIHARTDDHEISSPKFTVWGMAMIESGGGGLREEEDGLLAPMPTFPPAATPLAALPSGSPSGTNSTLSLPAIIIGIFIALGIAVILIRRAISSR